MNILLNKKIISSFFIIIIFALGFLNIFGIKNAEAQNEEGVLTETQILQRAVNKIQNEKETYIPVQSYEKEKEIKLDIKHCSRCKEKNSPTQDFCGKCGNPLDEHKLLVDYNQQGNQLMNALIQNPDVKNFLAKKVIEMNLDQQIIQT